MRNCPHHISAWLSEIDYQHLKRLMDESGQTTSDIIRDLLKGQEIKSRPTQDTTALLRQLSAIGNNINQIAHTANATRSVASGQVKELHSLLEQIWQLVMEHF